MKKITVLTLGIILLATGLALAQQKTPQSSVQSSAVRPVDAGNKFCPVSGRQIGMMGPGVQVEYNGKAYHLCCGGCIATFNSNPAKYAKIAENQGVIKLAEPIK